MTTASTIKPAWEETAASEAGTTPPSAPSENASPLRSPAAFESYCTDVQQRLVERARERKQFLQAAHTRLTGLLHTARALEDHALYTELGQHRSTAGELLTLLGVPPAPEATSPTSAPPLNNAPNSNAQAFAALPASAPSGAARNGTGVPPLPTFLPPAKPLPLPASIAPPTPRTGYIAPDPPPHETRETAVVSAPRLEEATTHRPYENGTTPPFAPPPVVEEAPRLPRHPVRPLVDIEADAARLRETLHNWNERWPLRDERDQLNAPNALRLRAVACRQRRLEEEAGDTEVTEVLELSDDVVQLLDDAGDEDYTVALDYELEPRPSAYQWGEMAERYEEMARAQQAFEWWLTHRAALTVGDVQPLAESVAAIQQRFNRLLFRVGARDPFQQQLFDDLRQWAKDSHCYLQSLRPKVPIVELIERANTLEAAWEQAHIPVDALEQRQQVVEDVIVLVSESGFGASLAQDEERLRAGLRQCREQHIPASHRRLRDALLPWAALLEGEDEFKEFLREIYAEWERRQDSGAHEPEPEPDVAEDDLKRELEAVRKITQGKRCLILGGTCRDENRRKIEQALELGELVWPSTKPSDPLSRYDTEIRHSDIVALLTRFSRKEWKNAADICRETDKRFVHLTTGYGVSQVVHHFYTQLCPEAVETR